MLVTDPKSGILEWLRIDKVNQHCMYIIIIAVDKTVKLLWIRNLVHFKFHFRLLSIKLYGFRDASEIKAVSEVLNTNRWHSCSLSIYPTGSWGTSDATTLYSDVF